MRIETELLMNRYKDHVFRIAYNICKNPADADDIVQETFMKYHMSKIEFESEEHIKAWLIRVAINQSKDLLRSFWHRKSLSLNEYRETLSFETETAGNVFEQVMALSPKYRIILHLFYYEDYNVKEISKILEITESNVKVRLSRGRKILKNILKEDWKDDE